ncbi:MAG: flavodoxin domain-containing protein [Candidatus Margulisiibacteriota bacterium]|nr:flavodoxin domain-containing protein [Candidatus Margulisiibacteriota bacterium]
MKKVLITYYSETGNTERMSELIEEGMNDAVGVKCVRKHIEKVKVDELLEYDAIIIGSPTYYGQMAWQIKKLLDDSVKFHGKLDGKIGGAFASAANIGGGNETTIRGIQEALLVHGMIIQGDPSGDHYGPVSIGSPSTREEKQCRRFGERIAKLVIR